MRKSIILLSSMVVCLGLLTTSVFAEPRNEKKGSEVKNPVITSTTTSTEVEKEDSDVMPADVIKAKIAKLNQELAKVNEKIKFFQDKMNGVTVKEPKEQKDSKVKDQSKVNDKVASMEESINKMAEQDKAEVEKLNQEYQQWKTHTDNMVAKLNAIIVKIDEKLKTDLAAIDAKITAATDATVKADLQKQREALVKAADAKKAAINKYIAALKDIWADRQKLFEERKALQARRQAADLEFKNTLVAIKKDGLEVTVPVTTSAVSDSTSTKEIKPVKGANFQPVIDALKAKAARIQDQIKALEAQLASTTTTIGTTSTAIPVSDETPALH